MNILYSQLESGSPLRLCIIYIQHDSQPEWTPSFTHLLTHCCRLLKEKSPISSSSSIVVAYDILGPPTSSYIDFRTLNVIYIKADDSLKILSGSKWEQDAHAIKFERQGVVKKYLLPGAYTTHSPKRA